MSKIFSLDIETKSKTQDKSHALIPHLSDITVIGVYSNSQGHVFRNLPQFQEFVNDERPKFVTHNGKFDLKHLYFHGVDVRGNWFGDTHLLAVANPVKIPEKWLERYEARRQTLDKGIHRQAGAHSLKCLAPFHLNVDPFWETADHDNDDYVLTDARYTLELFNKLQTSLPREVLEFYNNRLFPWAKLLLDAEIKGIKLDTHKLNEFTGVYEERTRDLEAELKVIWKDAYERYANDVRSEIKQRYQKMQSDKLTKLKDLTPEKVEKTITRYKKLYENALLKADTELNLNSPSQLSWLLKDQLGLDITDFNDDESTGKEVLNRLSSEGRQDVAKFLEFRKASKIHTAFLPSYKELLCNERLHTVFNLGGTRTGRLSSSDVNLQQVPKELHELFIADPGMVLATYDAAQIEPRILLYYSDDAKLYEIFSQGFDLYGTFAIDTFKLKCHPNEVKEKYPKERALMKTAGLALFYGAGAKRLKIASMQAGMVLSDKQCQEMTRNFKESYEGIARFKKGLDDELKSGGTVVNLLGRPYKISDPEDVHMKGLNTLIQGSASDLILESASRMQVEFDKLGHGAHVLLLVHDEIVSQVPEKHVELYKNIIEKCMTNYDFGGIVKLKVEGKCASTWQK